VQAVASASGTPIPSRATLAKTNCLTSIVSVTAHTNVRVSVSGMEAGAIEDLIRPFRDKELPDAARPRHRTRLRAAQRPRRKANYELGSRRLRLMSESLIVPLVQSS
jgi:FixJ family two-component response regulator